MKNDSETIHLCHKQKELDIRQAYLLRQINRLKSTYLVPSSSLSSQSKNLSYFFDLGNIKRFFKGVYWLTTGQLNSRLARRNTIQLIRQSGLFDTGYYWANNPYIKSSKIDPIGHYVDIGAYEGKDPNPLFDTSFYLEQNPELASLDINPLAHYITQGIIKGLDPHPLFDTSFYLEQNPEVLASGINPLVHYLTEGASQQKDPHPLFDTSFYLEQNPDILELAINPLVYYLTKEINPDLDPHPLFDTSFYLVQNPEVLTPGINPLIHYLSQDISEKLKPHPLFDTTFYLEQNPFLISLNINPLIHYITQGVFDNLNPHPLFDTSFYLQNNPDVAQTDHNPLSHYIAFGATEGRNPHPLFDTNFYRQRYLNVEPSNINPLVHYTEVGYLKQYETVPCQEVRINSGKSSYSVVDQVPQSQDANYQKWLEHNYPTQSKLQEMALNLENLSYQPLLSVIMPVYNTPEQYLREAIESVIAQIYENWELCIADDASTLPHVKTILEEYINKDPRIKVVFRQATGHISQASNSAIDLATGEFIALLDHDDLLTPHAFYKMIELLNTHRKADMIYSDEDKINEQGYLNDAFFKPDWCPDSFLSRMYTCHLGVYRRSLIEEIGGFREGFEGSQDYDLVLRLTEKTEQIFHIPDILYHWRVHNASMAGNQSSKTYAYDAAKKALKEALERRKQPGKVMEIPKYPGHYLIRYEIQTKDLVSIIIPTKNMGSMLDSCLSSIFEKTSYPNYEVILIDNNTTEQEALKVIKKWQDRHSNQFKVFHFDTPFNYSAINNFGVKKSRGKYLLFLNNDTEVITSDWIEAMVEQSQRPSIGATGALLLYPDDTIQHAGIIAGIGGCAGHSHKGCSINEAGYFAQIHTLNNYSAVTGACLMCRREVFEEVGGFEEKIAVSFNDVDLCFKFLAAGYLNIYLPHVVLYHYESKTRGDDNLTQSKFTRLMCEANYVKTKWHNIIGQDPCYNPHLTLGKEDYSIKI